MASTFKLCRQTSKLFAKYTHCHHVRRIHASGVKCLFGQETLGLDNFQRQRVFMLEKVGDLKERFRLRMEDYINSSTTNTIFTDDLKTIVHIAETHDDLDTAIKMIKRFHNQTSVLRFSNFVFGPLVMRMLHNLKRADIGYSLFKDPDLKGFFSQMSSYIVLMDMLFEAGEYEKVLEVSRVIRDAQLSGVRQPVDCVTLATAACLKLNTKESMDFALQILNDCQQEGSNLSMRTIVYLIYLALKQGEMEVAYELLSVSQGSRTGRVPIAYANVKAMVLARHGAEREAIAILEDVIKQDMPQQMARGASVFPETLDIIEQAVQSSGDKELQLLMTRLKEELIRSQLLSDTSYDDYIFGPIIRRRNLQDSYKRRPRSSIEGYQRPAGRKEFHRHGLQDEEHMVI